MAAAESLLVSETVGRNAVMRQERFETPGPLEVLVDNKFGDVRVITHTSPTTEVDLRAEGAGGDQVEDVRVEHERFDGTDRVIVEVPYTFGLLRPKAAEVTVTVRLPEGALIDVETISGRVTGTGYLGGARAKTTSGNVSLGSVGGDLVVSSMSGDLTVDSVTGGAEVGTTSGSVHCAALKGTGIVKTVSGDIEVGSADGPLTIETSSGAVSAGELADGCDLKTVSGDQRVRRLLAGQAEFKTVSGNMTIAVARGTAVTIDAESLSGSLSSEIELSSDEPAGSAPDEEPGPHAELRARTVSGDVRIKRA
jgi:hypothetical protein